MVYTVRFDGCKETFVVVASSKDEVRATVEHGHGCLDYTVRAVKNVGASEASWDLSNEVERGQFVEALRFWGVVWQLKF